MHPKAVFDQKSVKKLFDRFAHVAEVNMRLTHHLNNFLFVFDKNSV